MSPLPSSPPPGPLTNSASTEPNPAGFSFGSRPGVISEDKFTHERKPSPSRQSSFIFQPSKSKRQGSSNLSANGTETSNLVIATSQDSPVLVDFVHSRAANADWRDAQVITQSPASRDSLSKMLSRTATTPVNGYNAVALPAGSALTSTLASESAIIYGHIHETANKRISTLDYLRKAHEGRLYWFNTLMFTQADLSRMASFASTKIARRATNYLLLGLSLPAVIDFNANTPVEFLRALNTVLGEFDTFQALHSDGALAGSLTRTRIPQMFRRVPGGKTRRASGQASDIGLPMGTSATSITSSNADTYASSVAPGGSTGEGVMQFGVAESDLLPGEEYTYLLTPSLPFDPDFLETFATLCDVLIDAYTKLMSLLPSPKECTGVVADLFAKADSKVRKIIIQGCVKEFEDHSRAGIKMELAGVGKVVFGGLM